MLKKIGIILVNFMWTSKIREVAFVIGFPFIVTMALYLFCNGKINEFNEFIKAVNDTAISITALLSAFGLASLSILVTSSNENIQTAKDTVTTRKDIKGKFVSYYKLQVIRNFFSLFIQFGVLIIAIIFKFVSETSINVELYFYIEVFLLLVSIFSQIFVITSIYYLFVTPRN